MLHKYGCRCITELWNNLRNEGTVPVVIVRLPPYVARGTPNVQNNCLCTLVTPDVALFENVVLYGHWVTECVYNRYDEIQWSLVTEGMYNITYMMRYSLCDSTLGNV